MKKMLLIIALLLFTGCTAEYNLHFGDDLIEEKITIIPETPQEQENTKTLDTRDFFAIIDKDRSLPYEKRQLDINSYKAYQYSYNYSFNEFKQSNFTRCYDAYTILEENDVINFNTSRRFNCMIYDYMKIDDVKINITTDYKVIDNNADEINGNVYTWNINDNNFENKPINFSYYKKQKRKLTFKEFIEKNKMNIIILSCTLVGLLIFSLLIFIRHKRVNKI